MAHWKRYNSLTTWLLFTCVAARVTSGLISAETPGSIDDEALPHQLLELAHLEGVDEVSRWITTTDHLLLMWHDTSKSGAAGSPLASAFATVAADLAGRSERVPLRLAAVDCGKSGNLELCKEYSGIKLPMASYVESGSLIKYTGGETVSALIKFAQNPSFAEAAAHITRHLALGKDGKQDFKPMKSLPFKQAMAQDWSELKPRDGGALFHADGSRKNPSFITPEEASQAIYRLGLEEAKAGRFERAGREWINAIKQFPENPLPYVTMGQLHQMQGKPDESVGFYTVALDLLLTGIEALNQEAKRKGLTDEEMEASVQDLESQVVNVEYNLGNLYFKRSPPDYTRAVHHYLRVMDFSDSKDIMAMFNLAVAYEKLYDEGEGDLKYLRSAQEWITKNALYNKMSRGDRNRIDLKLNAAEAGVASFMHEMSKLEL